MISSVRNSFLYGALLVMMLGAIAPALGQRSFRRAEGDVERLLEDARNAYENFELEQAESELKRAISLIDRFDMRTPLAADVFVQMGIVVYAKKRDGRRATSFFERAFAADSGVVLDRNSANPTMERLFEAARARANRGGGRRGSNTRGNRRGRYDDDYDSYGNNRERGRSYDRDRSRRDDRGERRDYRRDSRRDNQRDNSWRDDGSSWGSNARDDRRDSGYGSRDSGRRGEKLTHEEMRKAPSDRALELWVSVDPDLNREIYQLFVYFRSAATTSVQKAVMRAAGSTEFRVTIPRRYVVGREFVYYFVAEARSGRKVATLRSAQSPFRVRLSGDVLGGASSFASGSSLDYGDEESAGDAGNSFSFAIGTGSGFGFVTKDSRPVRNTTAILETEGFAPAILHLTVEADAWATEKLSLGAFGRIQVVEFATLFGGRLQYKTSESRTGETRLRFGGGYGNIRHLVKIQNRNDTTLDGPFCATGGFVYLRKLSGSMKFKTALDYIQLFGDSPSYHFDLTLGIELGF